MFITITFINTLMHQKFILASSSKSRYKILKNAGLNFTQKKPNCNEEDIKKTINRKTKPEIFAKKLSYEKARSVSKKKCMLIRLFWVVIPSFIIMGKF